MKSFERAAKRQREERKQYLAASQRMGESVSHRTEQMEGMVNKRIADEIQRVRKLLRKGIGLNDIKTFLNKKKYFGLVPGDADVASQKPQPEPQAAIEYRARHNPEYRARHRTTGAVARADALRARAGRGKVPKPASHTPAIMGTVVEAKPSQKPQKPPSHRPVPKLPNTPQERRPPFALKHPLDATLITERTPPPPIAEATAAVSSFLGGVANPMAQVYGDKPLRSLAQKGTKFIEAQVFDK